MSLFYCRIMNFTDVPAVSIIADLNCTGCGLSNITSVPGETSTFTDTPEQQTRSDHLEFAIAIWIVKYIWPLIVLCGTFGNALSFCVLIRKAMSDTSVYFYLAMLAIADIGVLLLSAFKTWIRVVSGFEMLHVSGISCKLIMYIFLICLHMSAWFVIAVTVDRFIVIWLPLSAYRSGSSSFLGNYICRESHQCKFVSAGMLITLLLYNGHLLWTIDLKGNDSADKLSTTYYCRANPANHFMSSIFPVMKLLSYCVIPFFIVLILNAAIITRISKTKPLLSINRPTTIKGKTSSHQSRITGMLLTVSITWLLLTGPFTIWSLVPNNENTSSSEAQSFLIKTVCFTLMYMNHSINFYLYCLTGAKFRRQLKEMLCSKNIKRNGSRIYTGTQRTSLKIGRNNSNKSKQSDEVDAEHKQELCNEQRI